jgi:hypothetical protein
MTNLFALYGTIPYYIDKSEMGLSLVMSGHKTVTIISREALINYTKINGALEGWVLSANANPHPLAYIPFLCQDIKRWVIGDARLDPGMPLIYNRLQPFSIRMKSEGTSSEISVSCPQMDFGTKRVGGLRYPAIDGNIATYPFKDAVQQITRGRIQRHTIALFGGYVLLQGILPIVTGTATSDTIKSSGYPGPALIIYHDQSFLFPVDVDLTIAIPATWAPGAWQVGTYDSGGLWTAVETITPTYTYHAIGTLTPTQIQAQLYANRDGLEITALQKPIYYGSAVKNGYYKSTEYPLPDAEQLVLRSHA